MTVATADEDDDADNCGSDDTEKVAHSCTRFPCYLGLEI